MSIKKGVTKFETPIDELEVMAGFISTPQFVVMKRWKDRYIKTLKDRAFGILETDPNMAIKHVECTGQALGLRTFFEFLEKVGKEIEHMEKEGKE